MGGFNVARFIGERLYYRLVFLLLVVSVAGMTPFSLTCFDLVTGETEVITDESLAIFQNPDLYGELNRCLDAKTATLPRHLQQYSIDIPMPDVVPDEIHYPGPCYALRPNPDVGDLSNITPLRAMLGYVRNSRMVDRRTKQLFQNLQRYLQKAPRAERIRLEAQMLQNSPVALYLYSMSLFVYDERFLPYVGETLHEINHDYDLHANDLGFKKVNFKSTEQLPVPFLATHFVRPAPANHRQLVPLIAITLARRYGLCPLPDPQAKYFIPERSQFTLHLQRLGHHPPEILPEPSTEPPDGLYRAGIGAMSKGSHPLPGGSILRYTSESTSFGNALFTVHARKGSGEAVAMLLIAIYDVNADEMWEGVEYLWENSPLYNFQPMVRPAHTPWAITAITPEGRKLPVEEQRLLDGMLQELPFIYTRQMRTYNQLRVNSAVRLPSSPDPR
jgi:hypothetical protein